jgi:hypothetical protein
MTTPKGFDLRFASLGLVGVLRQLTGIQARDILIVPTSPREASERRILLGFDKQPSPCVSLTSSRKGTVVFLRPVLRLVCIRTSHSILGFFISRLTQFTRGLLGGCLYWPCLFGACR